MTRIVIVVDASREFAQTVADTVVGHEVGHLPEVAGAHDLAQAGRVGVIVFGPHADFDEALDLVEEARGAFGAVMVVRRPTTTMMRRAMRANVSDVLTSTHEAHELVEAVDRAWPVDPPARQSAPDLGVVVTDDREELGKVVTVFAAKGGCGKSTVATNLAAVLVRRGRKVCLLDLDLQFGDAAIMFQLRPTYTIVDVVASLDELDEDTIGDFVTVHDSGVHVLSAPLKPSQADAVHAAHVVRIIDLLRRTHDHVVIDTPAMFTDNVLAAIDQSDRLVVVGGFDVPSIKNLRLGLITIRQLGVSPELIDVVMSRANAKVGLRLKEVERTIGATIDVAIPSHRDVTISLNHGLPLVLDKPHSPVAHAIDKLADRVLGLEAGVVEPQANVGHAGARLLGRRVRATPTSS